MASTILNSTTVAPIVYTDCIAVKTSSVVYVNGVNLGNDLLSDVTWYSAVPCTSPRTAGNTIIRRIDSSNFLNILIVSINTSNAGAKAVIFFTYLVYGHVNLLIGEVSRTGTITKYRNPSSSF